MQGLLTASQQLLATVSENTTLAMAIYTEAEYWNRYSVVEFTQAIVALHGKHIYHRPSSLLLVININTSACR